MDGNAISPERMASVAAIVTAGGAEVIDGAIIGHPAWKPGTTYLHLSGPKAAIVADCFTGSVLTAKTMSSRVGDASALKMCYAALTKGTAALLCGILATSEQLGVRDALYDQWRSDGPGRVEDREKSVTAVTSKAWRWVDEMEEIARTFEGAGQPGGFHHASADIFRRLSSLKEGPHPTALALVLEKLQQKD
jgi:3-hydroxyisobutyrate dehydrogenase-like beta-hydroxyacid dehydrogenase